VEQLDGVRISDLVDEVCLQAIRNGEAADIVVHRLVPALDAQLGVIENLVSFHSLSAQSLGALGLLALHHCVQLLAIEVHVIEGTLGLVAEGSQLFNRDVRVFGERKEVELCIRLGAFLGALHHGLKGDSLFGPDGFDILASVSYFLRLAG